MSKEIKLAENNHANQKILEKTDINRLHCFYTNTE